MIGSIDLPESGFQALWYYTLLLLAMAVGVAVAAGYALRGLLHMWRREERGAALVLGGAAATALLLALTMAVTAVIGLLRIRAGTS